MSGRRPDGLRYRGPRAAGNKARAETAASFAELRRTVGGVLADETMLIMTAGTWRAIRQVLAHLLADVDEALSHLPPPLATVPDVDGEPLQIFGMVCTPEEQHIVDAILVTLFGREQADALIASARALAEEGQRVIRAAEDGTVLERLQVAPAPAAAVRGRARADGQRPGRPVRRRS